MKYYLYAIIIFAALITGCGKGIEPEPEKTNEGMGGKVLFKGVWPDSISRTHIVIFKTPLTSSADFNIANIAYVSLEIPYGVTEYSFSTADSCIFPINAKLSAGTYSYIAVAQQKTQNLTLNRADWFVAGVYYAPGDSLNPGIIKVNSGQFIGNINITCDFNNPPPQPPGEAHE